MVMLRWDYRTSLIELEDQILTLGRTAQSMVPSAMEALLQASAAQARHILLMDDDVDVGTHAAEAKIVELLTLQAPVAEEMRLMLSLQKVISSVERIGDHCLNIARLGAELAGEEEADGATDGADGADRQLMDQLHELGRRAERAVGTGLDCFSQRRTDGVDRVERVEEQLDLLHGGLTSRLIDHATTGRAATHWAVRMVLASRQLERIGDHAVGIAEEGAFVASGVRRRPRAQR